MGLDLETFLITLSVITDDWCQKVILPGCAHFIVGARWSP